MSGSLLLSLQGIAVLINLSHSGACFSKATIAASSVVTNSSMELTTIVSKQCFWEMQPWLAAFQVLIPFYCGGQNY